MKNFLSEWLSNIIYTMFYIACTVAGLVLIIQLAILAVNITTYGVCGYIILGLFVFLISTLFYTWLKRDAK